MPTPQSTKGFTLIEALVAISILVIAALGPLTMLAQAISHSAYARNQVIGAYLAREGVELVLEKRRLIRDENLDSDDDRPDNYEFGLNWIEGQGTAYDGMRDCIEPSWCGLDPIEETRVMDCSGSREDECKLYYDSGQRFRLKGASGATSGETGFTRKIQIRPRPAVNGDNAKLYEYIYDVDFAPILITDADGNPIPMYEEADVVVQMKWMDKVTPREFIISTLINKL